MIQPTAPGDDHACPTAFVVLPTVIGALLWLCTLLSRLPQY